MNEIKKMAIETALNNMLESGHVSICTVDKILKITGGIPSKEDYEVLSLLHCVSFKDMPKDLLRGLPILLNRVICADGLQQISLKLPRLLRDGCSTR